MTRDIEILQRDLRLATRELERLNAELRVTRAEIEGARRARSAIVSLSQELRTPLNMIMGFSQLLKSSMPNDDGSVEQILSAGCQMIALIDQIIPAEIRGTEGRLELPRVPGAAVVSILYVEDNVLNFSLVERILAPREGIKLFSAKEGKMAVPLAREHRPALILLDLNLPDMHGTEVLRRLREDPMTSEVPVVVISADATPSQIERLLAAGARNYLTKPFDIKRFLYTVDEALAEQARRTARVPSALMEAMP